MNYYFVDDNWVPLWGEEAQKKLKVCNDAPYLDREYGVISVPKKRWQAAQSAEKNGWMNLWQSQTKDRNDEHYMMFFGYLTLRGQQFAHAIELGCGPFTNLRYIGGVCKIDTCTLLDPLINDYRNHPHCVYKGSHIQCINNAVLPVAETVSSPVEEFCISQKYNLVVLINVLQHCYDARAVFSKTHELLADEGIFIFHDCYYDHHIVSNVITTNYDQGHPLRVDRKLINSHLDRYYPLYKLQVPAMDQGLDKVYFIGKKNSN